MSRAFRPAAAYNSSSEPSPDLAARPARSPPLPPRPAQKPKAQRFLGYCFVANRDSRSVGVVDLTPLPHPHSRSRSMPRPSQVLARPKTTQAYVLAPRMGPSTRSTPAC